MANFQTTWKKPQTPGIPERIGETIKPKGPLKPRVETAIKRLQKQITKLDAMITKLKDRDTKIFARIVEATQNHDSHTSKVLSNELAEVRKVTQVMSNARMSLERIELRLTTCHDLGDTVVAIMPTMGIMKGMQATLGKFMPGAEAEITNMADMLGGMMTDTFSNDSAFASDTSLNGEAENILREAAAVATTSFEDKFPATPTASEDITSTNSERFM